MEISMLNPIGYEAKTQKGNNYKHSNICKSALIGATGAIYLISMKQKNFGKLAGTDFYGTIKDFYPKLSENLKYPINILGFFVNMGGSLWAGNWCDNKINEKRIKKVDAQA